MPGINYSSHVYNPVAQGPAAAIKSASAATSKDGGFSFDDLLDIVNPLQHLPVIGTLYRAITGDTMKTPEKIAGDTLYGGLWGFVGSLADSAFEAVTGKNVGDTVLAFLMGKDGAPAPATAVAQNQINPAASAAGEIVPPEVKTSLADPPAMDSVKLALASKTANADIARRAAQAYKSSMGLAPMSFVTPDAYALLR